MVLLPLLFLAVFSEPLYRWLTPDKPPLTIKEEIYLDSLVASIEKQKPEGSTDSSILFPFNPNQASLDELTSLGIPEKISKRIIQYRTKGGVFRIKSDIAKMYGMDSALYSTLFPFIYLPEKMPDRESKEFSKQEKQIVVIQYDLNLADTTDIKSVRGIGSVLAKRIIKYRESLGGFIRFDQIREIYGLDSLVIGELKNFYVSDGFKPRQIEVNHATEKELDNHPYLSARDARSILTFRVQHGNYTSTAELLKIKTLNETTVTKIGPYLSFE